MKCKTHYRLRKPTDLRRRTSSYQYTPLQVAEAYGLPIPSNGGTLTGKGQTIGIIELGGAFSQSDLTAYLTQLGLPNNTPTIIGTMSPDPGGADVEVMLDTCIIAALCPSANIRIYFAENTSSAFIQAVQQATNDGCNAISISWGGPETNWSFRDRSTMDSAIARASSKNVNVYVAAGDNGADDGTSSPVVDYPASSPYAIGCGGTNLQAQGSTILRETVWNDGTQGGATGGGYSQYYSTPSYQALANKAAQRGVPDVAGVADPNTGWLIIAGGSLQVVGGTSAVAPLWAAINALVNEASGKNSSLSDMIYYANTKMFNDITVGNNGQYSAGVGWDPCTGLGTPRGTVLFPAVSNNPPSPVPAPSPSPSPSPTPTPSPNPTPTPSPNPMPTPTPSPNPSPSPVGAILAGLQQNVDAIFAQAEASHPFLRPMLESLQSMVDGVLAEIAQSLLSQTSPRSITPTQIKAIVDGLMTLAEGLFVSNPTIENLLADVKNVVDTILSSITASSAAALTGVPDSLSSHSLLLDRIWGLPPGTILQAILQLLPVVLKLFGATATKQS